MAIIVMCTNLKCPENGYWTTFGKCPTCEKELDEVTEPIIKNL